MANDLSAAELVEEVEQLRSELSAVSEELDIERAHRSVLQRAVMRFRSVENLSVDELSIDGRKVDGLTVEADRPEVIGDNVYVFDDEDASRAAFDEFFAAPDPHLEKVRGFLLD